MQWRLMVKGHRTQFIRFSQAETAAKANHPGASTVRFRSRDVLSASGMRRSTLLELCGMELHEVAHVRRCFAGELAHYKIPRIGHFRLRVYGLASNAL